MPCAEDAPPNARLTWPAPPKVHLYQQIKGQQRPVLEGDPVPARSARGVKVAAYRGVAGVRFVLADGNMDGRVVAVAPGQPCEIDQGTVGATGPLAVTVPPVSVGTRPLPEASLTASTPPPES